MKGLSIDDCAINALAREAEEVAYLVTFHVATFADDTISMD